MFHHASPLRSDADISPRDDHKLVDLNDFLHGDASENSHHCGFRKWRMRRRYMGLVGFDGISMGFYGDFNGSYPLVN